MSKATKKYEFSLENEYQYNRTNTFAWIWSHVYRYKFHFVAFCLTGILRHYLNALLPAKLGEVFEAMVAQNPELAIILQFVFVIFLLVLFRFIFELISNYAMVVLSAGIQRNTREEFYLDLLGKSQSFHNRRNVGDLMTRCSEDVSNIGNMFFPGISLIFYAVISVVIPLIFVFFIHNELLFFPLLFTVCFVIALYFFMSQLVPAVQKRMEWLSKMNVMLTEALFGIEVVKSEAQEQKENRNFLSHVQKIRKYLIQEGEIQARYLPPLIYWFFFALCFLHAMYLYQGRVITLGEVISFLGLIFIMHGSVFLSLFSFAMVQLGITGSQRLLEVMNEPSHVDENLKGYGKTIKGDVQFDSVNFSFERKQVLEQISFQASAGQTIAIVGRTGAGKSTLTKLINRIYDADHGQVLVDGINVQDWKLDTLRSQIATIEQDIFLFSRSIRDNITFGIKESISQEAIEEIAKKAQAHQFIMNFKDGYDTILGERGVTLSGGQKQRIAIARALLTNPKILIIDDSTSAIDSETEDQIQKAIRTILQGCTTFLITHRIAQIRSADYILMVDQGKIIHQGTHQELLDNCAEYQQIFSSKFDELLN